MLTRHATYEILHLNYSRETDITTTIKEKRVQEHNLKSVNKCIQTLIKRAREDLTLREESLNNDYNYPIELSSGFCISHLTEQQQQDNEKAESLYNNEKKHINLITK